MKPVMYGGQGVQNFGGLSFANNQFQLADPAYDDFHALTKQREETWYKAKAGIESTADFIANQSVLGADKFIQEKALDKFTGSVKQFVDSGRYEEASFALDGAVRDFKNDKGFSLATANYGQYMTWAQEQRDKAGWNEQDKSIYINGVGSSYKGVQLHDDGTVSGSVDTRDMGDYVNLQAKIAEYVKGWDADVRDEVQDALQSGVWKQSDVVNKITTESKNPNAVAAYVKNFIDQDPEIKHFLETKRIINDKAPTNVLASNVMKSMQNSTVDAMKFDKVYAEKKARATTDVRKKELKDFEEKYAVRDKDGIIVKNKKGGVVVNPFFYTLEQQMLSSGGITLKDVPANGQALANNINEAMDVMANVDNLSDRLKVIADKNAAGEPLNSLEQVLVKANTYKQAMLNVDESLYKSEQAYQAFLPISGVKQTVSHLYTLTDQGQMWLQQRAIEKAEADKLVTLVTTTPIETAENYTKILDGGASAFEGIINKTAGDLDSLILGGKDSMGFIKTARALNGILAQVNKDNDGKTHYAMPISDIMTADDIASMDKLPDEVIKILQDKDPSTFNKYIALKNDVLSKRAEYQNLNNLYKRAEDYAIANDDKYPTYENSADAINDMKRASIVGAPQPGKEGGLSDEKALEILRGDYKSKNDNILSKYLKAHINSGLSNNEVNFAGVRQVGSGKLDKEFNTMMESFDNVTMARLSSYKNTTYKVYKDGEIITDNDGLNVNNGGWFGIGDDKISGLKCIAVTKNGLTNKIDYKFAIVVNDETFAKNPQGTGVLVISDNGNELKEGIETLAQKGGAYLNPESYAAIQNMQGSLNYDGNINYTNQHNNLYNGGASVVTFKNEHGNDMPIGTVRANYASDEDKNSDQSYCTIIFDELVDDGKGGMTSVPRKFKDIGEYERMLNSKYDNVAPEIERRRLAFYGK